MPKKNYYMILGVSRSESPSGIRTAFRDLARRYHPDVAGSKGTPFFQNVVEAYSVLSDGRRRASYDQGLRDAEDVEPSIKVPVITRSKHEAEPLIPEPLVPDRISLMRDFEVTQPSREEVLNRFLQNFVADRPSTRQLDALNLQIRISAEQSMRGGVLTLSVPVFYPCRRCHGEGRIFGYSCSTCGETGLIEEEEDVRIRIPPMVRHGTVFQLPLRGLGVNNLFLQIRILVSP